MRAGCTRVWSLRSNHRRAASALTVGLAFALTACSGGGTTPGDTAGTSGSMGAGGTGASGSGAGTTGSSGSNGAAGTGAAGTAAAGIAGSNGAAGTGAAGTAAAGTTGGTGTDGGAKPDASTDGGASSLVLPVVRNGLYTLEFGTTKLVVDPAQGERVVEYSLDGTNVLTNATANASYWGSTFWTAPEGEWMGSAGAKAGANMMLVGAFDTLPFTMTLAADNSFTGVGPNAMFATKTLAVAKKFSANLAAGAVDITYSITNQGTNTFTIGHWEVTRVYPDGLTFFPAPPAASKAPLVANPDVMKVTIMNGIVWFDHKTFNPGPPPGKYGKYSTDASGGWVAHVVTDPSGKGDLLLVKTFKDIPDGTAGTGHGEVEIYCREDRSYEEVEDHHEQVSFAAGAKIDWPVRWYLRRLPPGVARTVGNQQLVDYVTNLLK